MKGEIKTIKGAPGKGVQLPPQPGADALPPVPDAAPPFRAQSLRAWLDSQIAAAEKIVLRGPAGSGWQYNESKRPEAAAHAADLRGLRGLLFPL